MNLVPYVVIGRHRVRWPLTPRHMLIPSLVKLYEEREREFAAEPEEPVDVVMWNPAKPAPRAENLDDDWRGN